MQFWKFQLDIKYTRKTRNAYKNDKFQSLSQSLNSYTWKK